MIISCSPTLQSVCRSCDHFECLSVFSNLFWLFLTMKWYGHFVSLCGGFKSLCSIFFCLCAVVLSAFIIVLRLFATFSISLWSVWLWPKPQGSWCLCPIGLFSNASLGTAVAQHRSVTSNWLDKGERMQLSSTDRCTDPVHPWRCHLHFIGHLGPANIF